jgi:hypothetical protein
MSRRKRLLLLNTVSGLLLVAVLVSFALNTSDVLLKSLYIITSAIIAVGIAVDVTGGGAYEQGYKRGYHEGQTELLTAMDVRQDLLQASLDKEAEKVND